MSRIPEEVINDVLERADALEILGEYVQIKRAGSAYKGLCPFHSEKTPSFYVNPARKFYKCFGCGAAGSLFTFLMEYEGWSFPESVRHVAARVGVEVPETTREDDQAARTKKLLKERHYHALELAQTWFQNQLQHPDNAHARDYLVDRGIDPNTAKTFGLGFVPAGWTHLLDHLSKHNISHRECESFGLAIAGKKGYYDRFRARIMFPIVNIWGRVVAFGGRVLPGDDSKGGKYINSPETLIYRKSNVLYGLHATRKGIRDQDSALLVEGNFDVISLYAQGIHNAVCPMGTAITESQVRLLSRYTETVRIAFDGDSAGQAAVLKSLPVLASRPLDVRVITLQDGEDPDSFIREHGKDAFQSRIEHAQPIIAFALDDLFRGVEGAPIEVRVSALKGANKILQNIQDPLTWKHYAAETARRLDIPLNDIRSYLKYPQKLRESQAPPPPRRQPIPPPPRPQAPPRSERPHTSQQHTQASPLHTHTDPEGPPSYLDVPPPTDFDVPPPLPDGEPMWDGPDPRDLGPPPTHISTPTPRPSAQPTQPAPVHSEDDPFGSPSTTQPARSIPRNEAFLFQLVSDDPSKLNEFIENKGCLFLTDDRIILLMERAHERSQASQLSPEYADLARELSEVLHDPDFFEQICTLMIRERSHEEDITRVSRTYYDTVVSLQRRWWETEYARLNRILKDCITWEEQRPVLEEIRALNEMKKTLDTQYLKSKNGPGLTTSSPN